MIVDRLTLVGGIYMSLICIMPAILFNVAKVPFYFGGTSLLILVGVAIDTMAQAESFMISQRYDTAYKSRGKYREQEEGSNEKASYSFRCSGFW